MKGLPREAYSLVARLFADRLGKDPVLATEDDVRAHLLLLREEKTLAPSAINLADCGLRFFFVESLRRNCAREAADASSRDPGDGLSHPAALARAGLDGAPCHPSGPQRGRT